MNKPEPPKPPPMREYKGFHSVLVNEYKTVEWYTEMGKLFDSSKLVTKIPRTWFSRLFMTEDQKKLEKALIINREMCKEWPRT